LFCVRDQSFRSRSRTIFRTKVEGETGNIALGREIAQEECNDTTGIIKIHKSIKDIQCNGQEKKDKQRSKKHTNKTTIRVTRTPLNMQFPVLYSFMTYHWVCNYINRTGATSGTGTAYPSRTLEFLVGFVLLEL
jgi:hypothetical protein